MGVEWRVCATIKFIESIRIIMYMRPGDAPPEMRLGETSVVILPLAIVSYKCRSQDNGLS